MVLAGTRWNGPVYRFGRPDTLSGACESGLVRREVGEDRDQLGRVAAVNRQGRSDPERQAAVAFAKALIDVRGRVSNAQFAALKGAEWVDANIVEMIALTVHSCG